jgi:transcriptional regulator of acetoin/glycerol metabolism
MPDELFKDFRERWIDHGEREYVRLLLERHQGNVTAAAQAAGLARTYVYRLIKKHGL